METRELSYENQKQVAHFVFTQSSQKETGELREIKNRINTLLGQGVNPSDIAVLARQNKALQELAQYLKNYNVPFHLHSSGSFKKRREVMDALFFIAIYIKSA